MMREIRILAGLNLCNIYELNVFRNTKEKNVKRRALVLMAAWLLIIVIVAGYAGALTLGLILMGMAETAPAYLMMIASLVILFFGIFKSGSVIFSEKGYEILCSLPVSEKSIVISRFIRMYVENLIMTGIVVLPGLTVYGWLLRPGLTFYIFSILTTVFLPLAPMIFSTAFGAVVTAISSRMKHKSLVGTGLTILLALAIMAVSGSISSFEGELSEEMLMNVSDMAITVIGQIYPPAVWMGNAVIGSNFTQFLVWTAVSIGAFLVMMVVISAKFHSVCRALYSTTAKHDYSMESLRQGTALGALYKRELKRYLSSSVYVTNTIIGPIMGVVMAAGVFITGFDAIENMFMIPIDAGDLVPFILAAVFSMMPTTSVAISMEGKEWWILKSLPLTAKTVLNSKILMNLSMMIPFYLISEVLLILALKPESMQLLWLILIPMVIMVFSSIFGLKINLMMPVFDWENEAAVVKQSAASFIGGLGGMVVTVACGALFVIAPAELKDVANAVMCIALAAVTAVMYARNSKVNLQDL